MARRLVTEADRDLFVRLHGSGMTPRAIGNRCGWCIATVQRSLAARGVDGYGRPGPAPVSGPALERIVSLHTAHGRGAAEIARITGRTHTTIVRVLQRAGVYSPGVAARRRRQMVRDAIMRSEAETGRSVRDAEYWRSSACMHDLRCRVVVLLAHGVTAGVIESVLGVSRHTVRAIAAGRISLRAPSWARERDPSIEEIAERARQVRAERAARRAS